MAKFDKTPQTRENHSRFVPPYHFGLSLIILVYFLWSLWRLFRAPAMDTIMAGFVGLALLGLFWYARIFPLAAQDRLIQLEEKLRMREILPEDLTARIDELTIDQLIGLRFASDAELPDLTRKVLAGELGDRNAIKRAVQDWRGDYARL